MKSKRVILTREDNGNFSDILKAGGIEVIEIPLIRIKLVPENAEDVLSDISTYNWLVFSSVNGVRGFFSEFFRIYKDIRCLGICRIACVGPATVEELNKYYIRADVVPMKSTGEDMAKAMMDYESLENLNVLCVRGNLGENIVAKVLEKDAHAIVDSVKVYETELIRVGESSQIKKYRDGGADGIFFASSSAVESFVNNADKFKISGVKSPKAYAIGESTLATLNKYGIKAKVASTAKKLLELL